MLMASSPMEVSGMLAHFGGGVGASAPTIFTPRTYSLRCLLEPLLEAEPPRMTFTTRAPCWKGSLAASGIAPFMSTNVLAFGLGRGASLAT